MPQYSVSPELYNQSIPQITTANSIVMDFLSENPSQDIKTIIDACCGTGKLATFLGKNLPNSQVLGLDNAENMIAFANQNHNASGNVSFKLDDLTVFNESLKNTADLIVCSWAVSHIPTEQQKSFTNNLYQYLKKDGQLIVLFPVMGSILSTTIQEIAKSESWLNIFRTFENKRMTFTKEQYDELLMKTGFIDRRVHLRSEKIIFKNTDELECFITTSVARYLSHIEDPKLCDKFINEVSNHYQKKVGAMEHDIPYSITILSAIAKRPSLALLLQKAGSAIGINNSYEAVLDDETLNPSK